jgi:hypothetical protein
MVERRTLYTLALGYLAFLVFGATIALLTIGMSHYQPKASMGEDTPSWVTKYSPFTMSTELVMTEELCPPPNQHHQKKHRSTVLLLAVLMGEVGADRFFTGYYLQGVCKLLTFGGLGFWWIADIVLVLIGARHDKNGCPFQTY